MRTKKQIEADPQTHLLRHRILKRSIKRLKKLRLVDVSRENWERMSQED